jgi:hypothetical protein
MLHPHCAFVLAGRTAAGGQIRFCTSGKEGRRQRKADQQQQNERAETSHPVFSITVSDT